MQDAYPRLMERLRDGAWMNKSLLDDPKEEAKAEEAPATEASKPAEEKKEEAPAAEAQKEEAKADEAPKKYLVFVV